MEYSDSRRNFFRKAGYAALGSITLLGDSCNSGGSGGGNKKPFLVGVSKNFDKNDGTVEYWFNGKDLDGEIRRLVTRFNTGNYETTEVTGIGNDGRLLTGGSAGNKGYAIQLSKEIQRRSNLLEAFVIDNENKISEIERDSFIIPTRQNALERMRGRITTEGGFHHVESPIETGVPLDVSGYGEIRVPILVTRFDGVQAVVNYVGVEDDIHEKAAEKDALLRNGYDGLYVVRGPMTEVERLTIEFVANGYHSTRDVDQ